MSLVTRVVAALRKAIPVNLLPVWARGNWRPIVRESFAGAWQQNVEIRIDTVLSYHAVFTCISLISQDVGKLRMRLLEQDSNGIWNEVTSPAFSPVLRKPNTFQNQIQFKQNWIISKLINGNAYALLQRDDRQVVVAMYLLDPCRVKPLVAPGGEVFYELQNDNLSGLKQTVIVPASEIIHDRMNCLFHPLVGLSPIFAAGLAAMQGHAGQTNSTNFFENMSRPSGILVAPGALPQTRAAEIKAAWDTGFAGANAGKVAVLADGMKYQQLTVNAQDAQLIEQLKWSAEVVCSCFHVPPFKIGLGNMPTYQNAEVLNQIYYSDCLQSLIEEMEACMDGGLGIGFPKDGKTMGVECDLDDLLRMDSATQIKSLSDGVGGALLTPNEARKKLNKKPLTGGDTVYMQQQNFSLDALDKRDRSDPFAKPAAPSVPASPPAEDPAADDEEQARAFEGAFLARIGIAA